MAIRKRATVAVRAAIMSVFAGNLFIAAQGLPCLNIETIPDRPNINDNISIKMSGEWPDSCMPNCAELSLLGNQIYITTSGPVGFCLTVITPWSLIMPTGQIGVLSIVVLSEGFIQSS